LAQLYTTQKLSLITRGRAGTQRSTLSECRPPCATN